MARLDLANCKLEKQYKCVEHFIIATSFLLLKVCKKRQTKGRRALKTNICFERNCFPPSHAELFTSQITLGAVDALVVRSSDLSN